jgi:phosphohistidine phosphatase SixA
MNIYLVRHGEAVSEKGFERRSLPRGGKHEYRRCGTKMSGLAIFHSGILRAAKLPRYWLSSPMLRRTATRLTTANDPAIAERSSSESPIAGVGHLPI